MGRGAPGAAKRDPASRLAFSALRCCDLTTMSWTLKDKELEAVLAADAQHRYEYFVHRVCETRNVWALYQEGWASLGDGDEKLIPFWPHEKYAARFAIGDWESYAPKAIELEAFIGRWLPGMESEGIRPAIFPNLQGAAVVVSYADLDASLRHELAVVHGEEE